MHHSPLQILRSPAPSDRRQRRLAPAWLAATALALLAACDAGRAPGALSGNQAGPAGDPPGQRVAPSSADWTRLTPSSDTRHVYVSSSTGNDNNSGLTEQSPKRTIPAAVVLLRQSRPDWLHVKRGDQFAGGLGDWYLSGRSASEPMVVTTYGTSGTRPVFLCRADFGLTTHSTPIRDVAFVGLRFIADTYDGQNGQPYAVSFLQQCTRVLLEDCAFERFFTNLRFQGPHVDLKLRRSLIADAFTTGAAHAQGIYVEGVNGCLIEECTFDHNGWRQNVPGADATIFRHNIYIQGNNSNVVIRGNIIARGGSHGLQARSGGQVVNNLFLGNSINLLVGNDINNSGSVVATVIGNVMLDGKDINAVERRGWAAQFQCFASGEVAYNVAAHQLTGTAPQSFELDSNRGVGLNNLSFHDNVAYKWGAPVLLVGDRFNNVSLRRNDVQEFAGSSLLRSSSGSTLPGVTSAQNRMYTSGPANQWMYWTNQFMSLATWKSMVGDQTTTATQVAYPHPEEKIGDYDRATGGSGSLDSFLNRVRQQSQGSWNSQLVGTNVAAHFRSNFGLR